MENPKPLGKGGAVRRVLRYGAELAVVFLGVWLSLLAENWRQHRADSQIERSSIARMAEDLASDLGDLRVNLERAQTGVFYGRWLLAVRSASEAPPDSLARALSAVQFCSVFVENTGEYESLKNSGQLSVIADAGLRRRIVALYESRRLIRALHERDCQVNEVVFDLAAPYVVASEPPRAPIGQSASDGFLDSSRPRVTSVPDREALLRDRALRTRVAELVALRRFLVDQIVSQMETTEALRTDLVKLTSTPSTR